MSKGLTEFLVAQHLKNGIIEANVIDLQSVNSNLTGKVESLEVQVSKLTSANSLRDSVIAVVEEQGAISKKELRRLRSKAAGAWFKNNWEKVLIGGSAFGLGYGFAQIR
jgi:hypothetical protein